MADETKVLEIKVNYDQAFQALGDYIAQLEAAKKAEQDLKKAIKEQGGASEEQKTQLAKLKVEQAEYSKSITDTKKAIIATKNEQKAQEGSLVQLRKQLKDATTAFDELSRAEREGAKGQELTAKIQGLQDELKGAENATGRFQRSVGDYEGAIKRAINLPFGDKIEEIAASVKDAGGAMKAAKNSVQTLGAALKTLALNPVFLILSTAAAILYGIKKALNSSEAATARFNAVLAPFKRLLDGALNIIQKAAGALLSAFEGVSKLAGGFGELLAKLPLVGGFFKEINEESAKAIKLEQAKYDLIKRTREATVENARTELEVSKLRTQATDKEKYSVQERLNFIKKAGELEEERARRDKEIAQERLRIAEEEAARADNDAETEDNLAQLRADVFNAEKGYFDKTRELAEKQNEFRNQIAAEQKTRSDAFIKQQEEMRAAEQKRIEESMSLMERAQQSAIDLVKDQFEQRRLQVQKDTDAEIEALYKKYEAEGSITQEGELALAQLITNTRLKSREELAAIDAEEAEANRQAEEAKQQADFERQAQSLANRLELARNDAEQERALRIEQNELDRQQAVADAEAKGLSVEEVNAVYAQRETDIKQEYADKEVEIEKAKDAALGAAMGALGDLANELGAQSKAAAIASKVIALAEIAINQGIAIARGVKEAMAVPFPANIAAIATTVATIATTITQAIKTVKSAKFAEGGLVVGEGSGTSDSIPAKLSNGESVINAKSTAAFAPLLSSINEMGGGASFVGRNPQQQAIGSEMLAEAFARGASMLPRPVVSVQEITETANRVEAIESLAEL